MCYHLLPTELRQSIMRYLSQRDLSKLILAYSHHHVSELEAFAAICSTSMPFLDDCWDLVVEKKQTRTKRKIYRTWSFWPVLQVPMNLATRDLKHMYTLSHFVSDIVIESNILIDWSLMSKKPRIIAKFHDHDYIIPVFENSRDHINMLITNTCDDDLETTCRLITPFGLGEIKSWILRGEFSLETYHSVMQLVLNSKIIDLEFDSNFPIDLRVFCTPFRQHSFSLQRLSIRSYFYTEEQAELIKVLMDTKVPIKELDVMIALTNSTTTRVLSQWFQQNAPLERIHLTILDGAEETVTPLFETLTTFPNNLKELILVPTCMTENGFIALSKVLESDLNQLRILKLKWSKFSVSSWTLFANAIKSPHCKLQKLQLCRENMNDVSNYFFHCLAESRIEYLDLSLARVDQNTIQQLSNALETSRITSLVLKHIFLSKLYVTLLGTALKNSNRYFQVIDLSFNHIDAEGAQILVNCLRDRSYGISTLCLVSNKITRQQNSLFLPLRVYPCKVGRLILGSFESPYEL